MKPSHPTFLLLQLKRLRFNAWRALTCYRTCRRYGEQENADVEWRNYHHWHKREFQTLAHWQIETESRTLNLEA